MSLLRRPWSAPLLFVLIWSTGFVSARYATRDSGPLTFLTIRLAIAGLLLAGIGVASRAPRMNRQTVRQASIAGVLLHAVYLGGVFLAVADGFPTGLAALVAGLHPVLTCVGAQWILGELMTARQWFGVALGLTGVIVVVVERLGEKGASGITSFGLACEIVSMVAMSAGTLFQRRAGRDMPLLFGTATQYAAATLVLLVGVVLFEGWDVEGTASTWFAMSWAVLVLSVGAVLLMLRLLQRLAAANVSSLFFLTPGLSVLEGMVLFGERVGPLAIVGLLVALTGVAVVSRG